MTYWPVPSHCAGFSPPTVIIDSDWSMHESYKDRFSDLASSQWTRPSFAEEILGPDGEPLQHLHDVSQDNVESQCVEPVEEISSSGIGNNYAPSDGGSTELTGSGDAACSDSNITKDAGPPVSESTASQTLIGVRNERLVLADRLPDDVGNSPSPYDVYVSLLKSGGSFGVTLDTNPRLIGGDVSRDDDDPFLGCVPFDPALWSVLNSARMWCGNATMSGELSLMRRPFPHDNSYDVGVRLSETDSSLWEWSEAESVIDHSGCFDVSDNRDLLSLQQQCHKDVDAAMDTDNCTVWKLPPANSLDRLMCTEVLGNEVWDGSRIAEAMMESSAVVTVLGAETVQQIWQPVSSSSVDRIDIFSSFEENLTSDDPLCCQHSRVDDNSSASGMVENKVDEQCTTKFSDWTDKQHCVSESLDTEVSRSLSCANSISKHESNLSISGSSGKHIILPLTSWASESSLFWNELHQHDGNVLKTSSTWDSQLFSLDCMEHLSLDRTTSSSAELTKSSENVTDGKTSKSDTVNENDGPSDDLFVEKTISFLQGKEDLERDQMIGGDGIENNAFSDLVHKDSRLDRDDIEKQIGDATDLAVSSTGAGKTRKLFTLCTTVVEQYNSVGADADCGSTSPFSSSSGDMCHPVSAILADLLEENNKSLCLSDAVAMAGCDDCEEVVQLMPSLASVSDIIFSDTEDSLDSEPASSSGRLSSASVFSSPEPCGDELVTSESDPSLGSLTVLGSAFDRLLHLDLGNDLCSAAQCYIGSFLAPVYTLDGSSLWFRDSHYISANVDALSRLRSDLPLSTGWLPSPSPAHESMCTAMAQCGRLLPSENTAFRDSIPQRLVPLVHLPPATNDAAPFLTSDIFRQSSDRALSPWPWSSSADESLSLTAMPSRHQFRPIGTPSTTDSELSEISTSAAEASTTADSLTDLTALVMSDVLADCQGMYQRFVISRERENEDGNNNGDIAMSETFRPSFKVQCDLEKAAQTGEPSPPVSAASEADLRLGCLVKQVLSQLSSEFPEVSGNLDDDILPNPSDSVRDIDCPEEENVSEASVTMSRRLSVIWDNVTGPAGTGLDSCASPTSNLSAVPCNVSEIWTGSATTATHSVSPIHSRHMSDIWSDMTAQMVDSAYVSDTADLLPSGLPDFWKDGSQQSRTKADRLQRMWKSVDFSDGFADVSGSVGMFKPQSIWSHSRPSSVTLEVETLCSVTEDRNSVTDGHGGESRSTAEHSDECNLSPSELDIIWSTTFSQNSPTSETDGDGETSADCSIFAGGGSAGAINSFLGKDSIWSRSEMEDVLSSECGGEADGKTEWNVDPLYRSGGEISSALPVQPDSVAEPPPLWIGCKANVDADVAFAFTHLVSGVVSAKLYNFPAVCLL